MRGARYVLWGLVILAALGLAFLSFRSAGGPNTSGPMQQRLTMGGPFTLVGGDGQPFSSSRLNGRPYAIFFGFTHCPDVCPVTLARMVKLREQLGRGAGAFDIVFVTVDPERDTPQAVGDYVKMFNSPVIGLSGSPAQIEQVKKQFGIFSQKSPDEAGGYTVDHTATVLLFGRDGKFDSTIATEEQNPAALAKLSRIAGPTA